MPRTINIKQILATDLDEYGYLGATPQFRVIFVARRGTGPEASELLRVVVPLEEFLEISETIGRRIDKQIAKADYLKELISDEKAIAS